MTRTGEAPATSELALAYNGANYKITPQNLVDSTSSGGTYSASIYLWMKTVYYANGVYNTWMAANQNDTTKYQDVNPNKTYYFGNKLINRITDSWIATYGHTSNITIPIGGGAVRLFGSGSISSSCTSHYAFIRNNRLYLYSNCANREIPPIQFLEV